MTAAWHVGEHLLLLLREVWREVSLLELASYFAPLGFNNSAGNIICSRTWVIHLRNGPARACLGLLATADLGAKDFGLGPLQVLVIVLGRGYLCRQPLLLLGEVHTFILAMKKEEET